MNHGRECIVSCKVFFGLTYEQEAEPVPPELVEETPAPNGNKADENSQIRGYVAQLKNTDTANLAYTGEMFLAEYAAFAQRFIRSVSAFEGEPYSEAYPVLSRADQKKMTALADAMIEAIQHQKSIINRKEEKNHEKAV
jgi:hypothetical protein